MKEITKTISRAKGQLEDFYDGWSDKSVDDIEHDIASSIRITIKIIMSLMNIAKINGFIA